MMWIHTNCLNTILQERIDVHNMILNGHFHLHFTGPFSLAVRETQCCTSMRHLVQIRIKKTLKYYCVHNYYTMKGNYFDSSRLNQVWQQNSLHTKTAEKLCFVFVIFIFIFIFCVCVVQQIHAALWIRINFMSYTGQFPLRNIISRDFPFFDFAVINSFLQHIQK